jgi:hypothetical protein
MKNSERSTELLALLVGHHELAEFYGHHEMASAQGSNYLEMCRGLAREEVTAPCQKCDGTGIRLLSKQRMAEYRRRLAISDNPVRIREHMMEEATCMPCNGSGVVLRVSRFVRPDSMFATVACPVCSEWSTPEAKRCPHPDCRGSGYVVPVTVRPTGSSRKGFVPRSALTFGSGDDFGASGLGLGEQIATTNRLNLDALSKTGEIVEVIRAEDGDAARALERVHGPEGERWSKTRWGRGFSVWDLTAPGKRFAEEAAKGSKAGSGYLLSPLERIAQVRQDEAKTKVPNLRWRALIRRTDGAARELLARVDTLLLKVTR